MTRAGFALALLIAVYAALLFSDFASARIKDFRSVAAGPSPSDFEGLHSIHLTQGSQRDHGA